MNMTRSSQNALKTLWEKAKLLIMSNFSFSHSVYKRLVLQICTAGLVWERVRSRPLLMVNFYHMSWSNLDLWISILGPPYPTKKIVYTCPNFNTVLFLIAFPHYSYGHDDQWWKAVNNDLHYDLSSGILTPFYDTPFRDCSKFKEAADNNWNVDFKI